MKTITLKLSNYIIKGTADLTLWGGGKGSIEMNSFKIAQKSMLSDKKILLENCNDGGFGVEKINGAICEVYENFEGNLQHYKTLIIGEVCENTKENHYNQY